MPCWCLISKQIDIEVSFEKEKKKLSKFAITLFCLLTWPTELDHQSDFGWFKLQIASSFLLSSVLIFHLASSSSHWMIGFKSCKSQVTNCDTSNRSNRITLQFDRLLVFCFGRFGHLAIRLAIRSLFVVCWRNRACKWCNLTLNNIEPDLVHLLPAKQTTR